MQFVHNQNSGNVATIKQEEDLEHLQTSVGNESAASTQQLQQKIILTPRMEIHRVIKGQKDIKNDDEMHNNSSNIVSTRSQNNSPVLISLSTAGNNFGREILQEQRVHVIKDGRYYDDSHFIHHPINNTQSVVHQCEQSSNTMPQLLSAPQSIDDNTKNISTNREVIVNTTKTSKLHESRENVSVVFRPPVVSSSCQAMRPPPPPPPKLKNNTTEEPSSSIPDLGKPNIYVFSYFSDMYYMNDMV